MDYGAQPQYWLLFDRIVQQLVLQSESQVDNDVEPLRSVDVKELVQHLAKEEEVIRLRSVYLIAVNYLNTVETVYRVHICLSGNVDPIL